MAHLRHHPIMAWWHSRRGNTYVMYGTLVGVALIIGLLVYAITTHTLHPWMKDQFRSLTIVQ